MEAFEALETVRGKLGDSTKTVLGYWLLTPFYVVIYILFGSKMKDPFGRYRYLIETGAAKYD